MDRGFRGVDGSRVREDDEGYTRETDRAMRHYMRMASEAREQELQRTIDRLTTENAWMRERIDELERSIELRDGGI